MTRLHRVLFLVALLCGNVYAVDDATRLDAALFLSEQLEGVLQAGEQPLLWLKVLGQRQQYKVVSCNQNLLTVMVQQNPFPVKWKEISAEDLAGISKSIAGEKGERLLVTAEVNSILGFYDKAFQILAEIKNPSDELNQKIIALTSRIKQEQKSAPADVPKAATPVSSQPSSAKPAAVIPPPSLPVISGNVINVGPSRPITSIGTAVTRAKAGDTILVDPGIYKEAFKFRCKGEPSAPVTIRGVVAANGDRPLIDCAGISVSGAGPVPRAAIQFEGSYCVVDSLEIKNARNGNNGSGVRFINSHHCVLRNSKITYCDMGIMGGDLDTGLIERCEIAFNGTKDFDGYSHNFYLNANGMVIRECYIHNSLFGQNFKTRGHYTELWYNFIADSEEGECGFQDSEDTAKPNSNVLMVGNVVVSKPDRKGNPSKFIHFGAEQGSRKGDLYLFNNTFVAGTSRIQFVWLDKPDESLIAYNNIFSGSDKILNVVSGKVKGGNNCIHGGSAPAGLNSHSANPAFVNAAARDFHLQAASPCINGGLNGDALTYTDGEGKSQKAVVDKELVFPLNSRPRPKKATLDIGAFGF